MQLDQADLSRIESLRRLSLEEGVLSLYMSIEPETSPHHGYVARIMDAIRDLKESAPQGDRERIAEEAEAVLRFVREEYTPHGSALAIFSSLPSKTFETFSFQLPVPILARFGARPFLQPLDALMEDFPSALIALADHEQAVLYRLRLGELEERSRFRSAVPGLQRQGGWSAFRYQRDHERHIHEHMVRVAKALEEADREDGCEYVVLAGTDETTHALANVLPAALQQKLAGSFRAEMFATTAQVIDQARGVLDEAERAQERALAERLVDLALAGGHAALGVDETLQMLREGRAHTLVVAEPAFYTPAGEAAAAVSREMGVVLEVVHGAAAETLAPYDGLGALLRY